MLRNESIADGNNKKSLEWSSKHQKKKHRKRLVRKVMNEACSGNPIETLCYLGRPLEDYVTADDAKKTKVEIQDFTQGLVVLTQQAKNPQFPRRFLEDNSNTDESDQALELFRDFFAAMDEIMARHSASGDDSDSDSDDSDSEDEEDNSRCRSSSPQNLRTWACKAQGIWDAYLSSSDQYPDEARNEGGHHPQDEEHSISQLDQQQQDQGQHQHDAPHYHDEASVAYSAAAISYTEASLMSASKGGAASVLTPPKLSDDVVEEGDSFDTIWEKHQMEGWDRYLQEDVADNSETMVYEAPNGYSFQSDKAFCEFLEETYGTCGSNLPVPQKKARGRSMESRNAQGSEYRTSSRSRSRSRSRDSGGINFSVLWTYLNTSLGWSYAYSTSQDQKIYGMNTTALWFRPGFGMKHRGEMGRDHFISEDSVVKYCQEQNIQLSTLKTQPKNNEEEHEDPEEEDEQEDDDSSTEYVSANDDGYATPDDQSTVPQDPGKPRLPSPPGTPSSGASGSSGGSYYSYDNDPDRYVFSNLWQRLKDKGWSWSKAKKKNNLDDYWYVKPASIRPESQWIKGTDYFCTEEEVVEFCKKRDLLSKKDRERRRNERMLRLEKVPEDTSGEEVERQSSKNTAAKASKPNQKKRGRPPSEEKAAQVSKPKHKKTGELASKFSKKSSARQLIKVNATKPSKTKQKRKSGKHRAPRKSAKSVGFSCLDENLKVDAQKKMGIRFSESPWARNKPRYDHKLCLKATGVTYAASFYYLPGEGAKNFTARYQNPGNIAEHFALNPQSLVWSSGQKVPSSEDERSFQRLIRYALVPGVLSVWSEIRKITRSETSFLLRKLGYRNIHDTFWEPPEALVATGHLEQRYSSLESLCESLWCLSGDLHTPPSATTRRRKLELRITETQFMAIRLRIAEGFSDSDSDEDTKFKSDSDSEEKAEDKKRKRDQIRESDAEEEEQFYLSPTDEKIEASEKEELEQIFLTPSEKKSKEFAEDEEQQMAMSPSKIKVCKFRKNPHDNTAPWTVNPLTAPSITWSKMYYKMGITFSGGHYYLQGESSRNFTKKFSKIDDVRDYINLEGNSSKYLDKLDDDDRKLVSRHLNYGNVPGNFYEWRKLRELTIKETMTFLNLLGFERDPRKLGWWQIPEGVPILEEKSYPTLHALCKALVRLPDLEDRTMGRGNHRRSRKKEEDLVLSDYQMMALRLRIAEGFEEHEKEEVNQVEEERKDDDENKPLIEYTDELGDQLELNTAGDAWKDAWKALKNLGCTYTGCYHIPGHGRGIDNFEEMINIILEKGVAVLSWENCTLDTEEISNLERYLKAFNARGLDFSLVKEALKMVTKRNVINYLSKLGIHEDNGKYLLEADEYSESQIVNLIRRTPELTYLHQSKFHQAKRRRSDADDLLSKLETMSLRLWVALLDIPLANMPVTSTIGRAHRQGKEMKCCNTAAAANQNKVEHGSPTKQNSDADSSENPETALDSINMLPKEADATSLDQSSKKEDITEVKTSTAECHAANRVQASPVTGSAIEIAEVPTEKPTSKSTETLVEIDLEEAVTNIETDFNRPKDTTEAIQTNMLPVDSTAMESASRLATILTQKSVDGPSEPRGNSNDLENNLTTPSLKKKRRKSSKKKRRTESFSSPPPGAAEFFTPKQHNMGGHRPNFLQETEYGISEPAASRTASSHGEAFGGTFDTFMTQPDDGEEDHHHRYNPSGDSPNLRDMDGSAALDFQMDSNIFSPEAVVATKTLNPSQHYGSRCSPSQHDGENGQNVANLFTQQDEDISWFDAPLSPP